MMNQNNTAACFDLAYLIGCAVNEIAPELGRVEQMNLELIHSMSCAHSLAAISCMALEDAYGGRLPEMELSQKWNEEKNQAIYKTLLFDAEREQLFAFLEEAGIWYLPLKGILLKDLYPKLGMRQMADNDILFDPAGQKQVHDWFTARGYKAEAYQVGPHDVYHKKPVYNFEMHTSLFSNLTNAVWTEYYRDVKSRLLPQEGNRWGRRFSDEDNYIYIVTHACKHQSGGGTGLRTLLDLYVYGRAKGDGLNWTYIQGELDKLGIAAFEEQVRTLSRKLFTQPDALSPDALTEEELALFLGFGGAGTYGTIYNHVRNRLKEMEGEGQPIHGRTKLRYIWKRLFPDVETMKIVCPFFYRHRWLLPVGYVYRLICRLIANGRGILAEAKALKKL